MATRLMAAPIVQGLDAETKSRLESSLLECAPQLGAITLRSTWREPYPNCDLDTVRLKAFGIAEDGEGRLVFVKSDPNEPAIENEAFILGKISGLSCVPRILCARNGLLVTALIPGSLLSERLPTLTPHERRRLALAACHCTRQIHRRGVTHCDIRPWNFLVDDSLALYLIDFEYAHFKGQSVPKAAYFWYHHGALLRTETDDWIDTCGIVEALIADSAQAIDGVFVALALALKVTLKAKRSLLARMDRLRRTPPWGNSL